MLGPLPVATMSGHDPSNFADLKRLRRVYARWLGAMAVVVALAAVGCSSGTESPVANDTAPANAVGQAAAVVVMDDLGREVRFERLPRRIVSLVPSSTEIVYALGAGDLLVGVTEYCDYPPEATRLPRVGGFSANTVSIETIIGMEPDVVLATGKLHQLLIAELERLNIPVVALEPQWYDDVCENILLLGRVTGQNDRASEIAAAMRAKADEVRKQAATIPQDQRVTVFYQVWQDPLMAATNHSFIGEMIEMAGGRNIFADLEQRSPQVSEEAVLARDPQVILAPSVADREEIVQRMRQRSGWDRIAALRNDRVHLVPNDMVSRPAPRLIEGLQAIAHAIYPEYFP